MPEHAKHHGVPQEVVRAPMHKVTSDDSPYLMVADCRPIELQR